MKNKISYLAMAFAFTIFLGTNTVFAQAVPWANHAAPFDFVFGNHIDSHQQTQLTGNGDLQGSFFIQFTGKTVNGLPEAVHGQDRVGWILRGVPVTGARLLARSPLTWCIDSTDLPDDPGFTHFHWTGDPMEDEGFAVGDVRNGFLLKLTAREKFFFPHHGGFAVTPGLDVQSHKNIVTDCG